MTGAPIIELAGVIDRPTAGTVTVSGSRLDQMNGTTVVYVTHDQALAARAGRTVSVRDGQIVADTGAPLIREEP